MISEQAVPHPPKALDAVDDIPNPAEREQAKLNPALLLKVSSPEKQISLRAPLQFRWLTILDLPITQCFYMGALA
jgi:hypothetical protein